MALIEVKDLGRAFGENDNQTVALKNISTAIEAGSFTAIMGHSGSGKSTLLHILGLLDYPSSGHYLLDGKDTASLSEPQRARLRNTKFGFVFQSFHLMARTTVLDNVILPLTYALMPQRLRRERALLALEQVEMSHRLDHLPNELSGGEKQRVAIARALVNDPAVVFADEPTGNLDSKTGHMVMELISRLHKRGRTVVVITHDQHIANYTERIIQIKDGEIIKVE